MIRERDEAVPLYFVINRNTFGKSQRVELIIIETSWNDKVSDKSTMRRHSVLVVTIATLCSLCHAKSSPSSKSSLPSSSLSRPKSRAQVNKSKRRRQLGSKPNLSSPSSSNSNLDDDPEAMIDQIFDLNLEDDFDLDEITANIDDIDSAFDLNSGASSGPLSSSTVDRSSFDMEEDDHFNFDFDEDLLHLDETADLRTKLASGNSDFGEESDDTEDEEYGQGTEKGALYDAYNLLHTLAQVSTVYLTSDLKSKPFLHFLSLTF